MAEYNGSIELISGLIQKNNADFPLMEASAVAFYETVQDADGVISTKEIRLPDKLKEVGISEKDKAQIVIDAVAAADSALIADDAQVGAKIATNATEINKLKGTVSDLASQIQKDNPNLRIFYDKKESFLYLYDDPGDEQGLIKPNPETGDKGNTISYTEILGGGGGQSLPLRLSLKVLNKNQQIILNGKSAELKFRAEMFKTDVEPETEVSKNLTFKLSVTSESRGTLTTSFVKSTNNDHSFDVTPYLGLGDNEITLSASYTEDKKTEEGEIIPVTLFASNYWTIKVIELYIDDTDFTDSTAFIDKSATWSGLVYGDVNKTIHYKLNGQDDWKTESNIFTDGYSASMTIPFQSHGVSTLEVYLTTQIDDTPEGLLRSDSKFYELLFINSSDPTPVLRLTATPNPMQQYTAGTLSYTVYSNQELMKDVTLIEGQNNIIFSGRISNATQNQSYTFMDAGEKNIKLSYNFDNQEYSKEITVLVEESEYQIGPITAGLVLDFLPTGRSNDAHDYNVFYNNAEKLLDKETASALPDINWSFSDNFDWYNGGWQVDDEGNTYFCVKAGTSVTIDYDPFDDDAMITQGATLGRGKEFKLIFKTTNVGKSDATFLTCLDKNNVGLQMNVHEAYINSNESSLYSPYSEEDIIEFDFNIFPGVNKNGTELLPSGDIIPMLMTYEDGVPFRPLIHTLSTSYAHANKSNIVIGSTDCDVHIYRMKTYDRYLKDSDVLKNFIADARNGSEMVDRHKRNLIYKSGKLTPNSLAEARPDLKIIKITCPKFTNSKSDFVPMTSVEMIHKNGDPYKDNWKFENCFLVGQGTTSNKYRDAGKNLELICSFDGEYYNKKVLQSEYFNNDKAKYYAYKTKLTLNPNDKTNKKDNSYDATLDENPGDGKIALYEDAYPNNYFNIKVNIASSDNANNALQANRYDRYMPYTTPAEKRDSRIKTTMDFVNCVVFVCETDPSGIEFPPSEVIDSDNIPDTSYHFYAIGNIGDSKKTDADRAYAPNDDKEFVVEILDNDKPNAGFPTGFKTEANEFVYPITREQWEATDGYRKVENESYLIDDNLPIFYELINGEYVKTEDETIDSSKTYYEVNYLNLAYENLYIDKFRMTDEGPVQDSGWAASYEMRYGEDTEENIAIWNNFYEWLIFSSNAEFKSQFSNWFVQNAALYYFLFTERYTMMDNRAKNSFWHWAKFYITEEEAAEMGEEANYYTIDNAAAAVHNGYRFDFWDYDNDTALGIDNNGQLKFSYGLEDIDKNNDGTFVFNAGNSVFFRRIRENFTTECTTVYNNTSDAWDPTNLITEYDRWQSEFPEALWIEDVERKYYRTYRGSKLGLPALTQAWLATHLENRMQGRKKYHRRQWERDQADYMDSKYGTERAQNKNAVLRCKTPPNSAVPADYTWHLQPYKKMYLRTYRGDQLQDSVRALDINKTYSLVGSPTIVEDAQLVVYSGDCIKDFGDLSKFYAYTIDMSPAKKVKSLTAGNETPGYANGNLIAVSVNGMNLLEELNIRNLKNVTSVSLGPSLKYLYAQGSGLKNAVFAQGGFIHEAYLPATVSKIEGYNLYYLNKIEMDDATNLTELEIDNCKELINTEDFKQLVAKASTDGKLNNKESVVRLTNLNWTLDNGTVLNNLLKCSGIQEDGSTLTSQSVLTGHVYIAKARQTELNAYAQAWPELTVEKGELIPQHLVKFYNLDFTDKEFLGQLYVDDNTICPDPIAMGLFETPVKEDAEFNYTFNGWIGADLTKPIYNDVSVIAQYKQQKKKFKVIWYNDEEKKEILQEAEVEYGQGAVYTKGIPTNKKDGFENNQYSLFSKWDKLTARVTDNMDVYPVWDMAAPGAVIRKLKAGTPTSDLTPAEINALVKNGNIINGIDEQQEVFKNGDYVNVQFGNAPTYADVEEVELVSRDNPFVFGNNETPYLKFDGSNGKPPVYLFDEDKDFTLLLDFTPGNVSSGTCSYISCGDITSKSGIFITQSTGTTTNPVKIEFTANPSYDLNPSKHIPTADMWYREICVIRHRKGDENLYVYRNNRYSIDSVSELKLPDEGLTIINLQKNNYPLVFGGNIFNNNVINTPITGKINFAKIWYADLGLDICQDCCKWIYTSLKFNFCGKRRYVLADNKGISNASFICQDLLDENYPIFLPNVSPDSITNRINDTAKKGGWGITDLREWMNTKLFAGLSIQWQQIIQQSIIGSMRGGTNKDAQLIGSDTKENITELRTRIRETNDYLYLPSLAEVNTDVDDIWNAEMNILFNSSTYPEFGGNQENKTRIKKYHGTNKKGHWTLRSPFFSDTYNSYSNPIAQAWLNVDMTGAAQNTQFGYNPDTFTEITFDPRTAFGICPCFSI